MISFQIFLYTTPSSCLLFFIICELLKQLCTLLYNIHHVFSYGGKPSKQWSPVFLLMLSQESTAPDPSFSTQPGSHSLLLPCNFLTTGGLNHGQSIKAYIFFSLFCEAFSAHPSRNYCHFFVSYLHLTRTVLVLDKFIILQLPLSLSYKVMFSKTPMI